MTKRRKSPRKSNATILAHRKFRWLEQLSADSHMSLCALRACIQIADRTNLDNGGSVIIGQDIIAQRLGIWRQRVNEGLQLAVTLGHLKIIRRGRDRPNEYRMVLKEEAPARETTADDVREFRTSSSVMMSGVPADDVRNSGARCPESRTDSPLSSPGALTEPPGKKERERDRASRDLESPPLCGGGALMGAPAEEDPSSLSAASPPGKDRKESGSEARKKDSGAVVVLDQHRAFHELRELWQRGHAKDDTPEAVAVAREAFASASTLAEADEILDGARAWVAAFEAGDGVRFLPQLPIWLAGRKWEQPPPTKRKRGRAAPTGQRRGKPDLLRTAFKMGGYQEGDDGKVYHPDGEVGCSFDWRASL